MILIQFFSSQIIYFPFGHARTRTVIIFCHSLLFSAQAFWTRNPIDKPASPSPSPKKSPILDSGLSLKSYGQRADEQQSVHGLISIESKSSQH